MENRVVFCLFAITSLCNNDNAKTHHRPDGIWRTRNNKSHRMRVSNVCSCRKGSFYSLFRRLKCSHCGSWRNLHHLPCSVFASNLHRHKISCPSIALECQSYECAQSRHWNCGFSGMITFFRAAMSFAFNSDKFAVPDIAERGFINIVRPDGTRISKPHNPLVGNVPCL